MNNAGLRAHQHLKLQEEAEEEEMEEDPNSFPPPPPPPMLPPGMEGMVPPPPPPRHHVGKYPPPPPLKPSATSHPHHPHPPPPSHAPAPPSQHGESYNDSEAPISEENSAYQSEQQLQQEYYGDTHALPTQFGAVPQRGYVQYAQQQQEEAQYVQPEYDIHPALRKTNEGAYRPYKRKAASSPTHHSSSSSSSSSSSAPSTSFPYSSPSFPSDSNSADDDIRPSLSLYQQHAPEPYVSSQASSAKYIPSKEEQSVGTYHYKSNPFDQPSAYINNNNNSNSGGIGPAPRGGKGASEEVRSADGIVGVAPYKRRTFTVEESREKKKQQTESAVNITNSVVASIREKLASGGRISKGQAKILNRDQEIISSIAMPTYVSHRTGSNLTPEEIKKAQDEHTRKFLGWKYHVAVKARNEQALQTKRQKK